nr:hypothetical protein [Propionicimonas sp.]
MKTNNALQVIFAFFLGLVVVAFVGIGVNTFYPEPQWPVDGSAPAGYDSWRLITGITLLVCATVILVVSLFLPEAQGVLSNGLLLGGVFTMVYAVGWTIFAGQDVLRFVVVAIALAVTIAIGNLKFVRRRRAVPQPEPVASDELADRLSAVEAKLDGIARALHG